MVKAQVKTGGRGKAGGVKFAATPEDALSHAEDILGLDIKGHIVKKLLIAEASDIAEEYYISFLLDRANRDYLAMCSVEGGMEIEEVAATKPDRLARIRSIRLPVDVAKAREIAEAGHLPAEVLDAAAITIAKLWEVFVEEDALLVEVNPLVRTPQTRFWRSTARSRSTATPTSGTPTTPSSRTRMPPILELKAKENDLNYVKLDGEVGVIGNGAGLVMSTLDVVALRGRVARRREAGQLPRHRRRRLGRRDGGRSRRHPGRRAGEERLRERSAASPPVMRWPTASSAHWTSWARLRASRRRPADGNKVDEGRKILADANHPLVTLAETMDEGADKAAELASK